MSKGVKVDISTMTETALKALLRYMDENEVDYVESQGRALGIRTIRKYIQYSDGTIN